MCLSSSDSPHSPENIEAIECPGAGGVSMHVSGLKSGYFETSLLERHMLPQKDCTCLAKVLCE